MIKLFEMFAGYGGASFALKKAGIDFECVGYSEIDKFAIQCYEQNHNSKNFGDCTKIKPEELPDFDLLTGGFPCQAFSVAGKGLGELDTRGTLFNEIIRIAEVKKPRFMLLENVKGLLGKKHQKTLDKILIELSRIGYYINIKVLNSKEHGIPQNRERVFFVCFRDYIPHYLFKWPDKTDLKISVNNLLIKNINRDEIKNTRLKQILNSPSHKYNLSYELINDTPSGISRQKDRIYKHFSPCLNCTIDEILFNINGEIINITGKECFRLMGFLNDEINLNNLTERQIKKLAGNGWDINLVSKIFKNMLK